MTFAGAARSFLTRLARHALVVVMALAVTYVVYRAAWTSDDAIITFRYVWNLLHGYGAVFNVGERVQGYTHALWFVMLAAATLVTRDEVYAATGLSLGLTFGAVLVLGAGLGRVARDRATAWLGTALVATLFVSSDSWRTFQTSGLEGALSTFLLVAFVVTVLEDAPAPARRILLIGSLLALTRPDLALIVTPPCALVLLAALREKRLGNAVPGLIPLLGFVVIRIYYGDFLPNTGPAKIGIYTFEQGVHQGLIYLGDWVKNEPVTTLGSFALLLFGLVRLRIAQERALGLGLVAYTAYLIVVGGDFMRGRLFMPVFVGNCAFGVAALARVVELEWRTAKVAGAVAGLGALGYAASALAPAQTRDVNGGVVNERVFYVPAQSFATYTVTRRLKHNEQFDYVAAYLKACGPVTIHSQAPGALGYYLGPELTVIDTLGLTDRVIAHLPRANLRAPPPRPGHPYRHLPIDYLASRRDVSILPGWEDAMRKLDCTLTEQVKSREGDHSLMP